MLKKPATLSFQRDHLIDEMIFNYDKMIYRDR